MADCVLDPKVYSDFATKDRNRLVGSIAKVLARKSPWMDVLDGGTLENVSDVVRTPIQEQAVVASSLVNPTFVPDITTCNLIPPSDQVGTTEYSYQLGTLRGRGPRVCVKLARTAFMGTYANAAQALEKGVLKIMNADVRAQLYQLSGIKAVINSGYKFSSMLAGDIQAISTPFPAITPNAAPSFKWLLKAAQHMRENLLVDPFEGPGQGTVPSPSTTMFKFIGSASIIEYFRNQLDVKADLIALTTGSYKLGEESIAGYSFQGPYRGIAFGIDSQPMRFNQFDSAGQPILIEPEIAVASTKGVASRTNPAWMTAIYEIGFLLGANSFKRLTPKQFTGEGTFKFAPQLYMGELEWVLQRDNDCNLFLDFGQHIYQIERAYQPMRPHAILPIAYLRCNEDLGLAPCSSASLGL